MCQFFQRACDGKDIFDKSSKQGWSAFPDMNIQLLAALSIKDTIRTH